MQQHFNAKQKAAFFLFLFAFAGYSSTAQNVKRPQPVWWFGESGAVNFNQYRGTTQMLNEQLTVPAAFHKADGIKPYASLLTEYRPNKTWGGILNVAFDNRSADFNEVMAPCNCPANLSTSLNYVSIEPSLRVAPFSSAFYLFGGPTLGININKDFTYVQEKQTDKRGDLSDVRKTVLSAQAGMGIDIPLSSKTNNTQFSLSPFVSFLTNFGQQPRSVETLSFYTVRTGIALKFGTTKKAAVAKKESDASIIPAIEKDVQFSVRAPKVVPQSRQVKETFALRNSLFFDNGSTQIPSRYVLLNNAEASSFKEDGLQQGQPDNLTTGRSSRQLAVYHNILNIMGDRLRANNGSTITLTGAADKNPAEGKVMAETIKQYFVNVFGIDGSRITTAGRDKPLVPSEQPGATKEIALLKEGDRRVDIESTSPELLLQVGGSTSPFLKPVQITAIQNDPLDSHVIFSTIGAEELLTSWSIDVSDEQGKVQHFGPFTTDKTSIPGGTILGSNAQGNYKIVMTGQTKSGKQVTKESSVSLVKANVLNQDGLRYSILFDFDQSKSLTAYEKFLTDVVAPLIPDNGTVIIHGHTDVIGEDKYNHTLSHDRAIGVQRIMERALSGKGKKGVVFETYGFGEDAGMAPFENNLPEERFYNRTVIIDIIPAK
jgi:outer membrane protein OmpA-like peptidoglycan-associated protein